MHRASHWFDLSSFVLVMFVAFLKSDSQLFLKLDSLTPCITNEKTCTFICPFIYPVSSYFIWPLLPQGKQISSLFPLTFDSSPLLNYFMSIIPLSYSFPLFSPEYLFVLFPCGRGKHKQKNMATFFNSLRIGCPFYYVPWGLSKIHSGKCFMW